MKTTKDDVKQLFLNEMPSFSRRPFFEVNLAKFFGGNDDYVYFYINYNEDEDALEYGRPYNNGFCVIDKIAYNHDLSFYENIKNLRKLFEQNTIKQIKKVFEILTM